VQPIVYSDFRYYKIEPSDLDSIEPEPMELLGGGLWRMCGIGIDEPAVQMVYEDFFPGHEYTWTVWLDQIDLVTEGLPLQKPYASPISICPRCPSTMTRLRR
jgi:hypothetical protein